MSDMKTLKIKDEFDFLTISNFVTITIMAILVDVEVLDKLEQVLNVILIMRVENLKQVRELVETTIDNFTSTHNMSVEIHFNEYQKTYSLVARSGKVKSFYNGANDE